MRLIAFHGPDEVLITTEEHEHELYEQFFVKGDRERSEYEREELMESIAVISANLKVD